MSAGTTELVAHSFEAMTPSEGFIAAACAGCEWVGTIRDATKPDARIGMGAEYLDHLEMETP